MTQQGNPKRLIALIGRLDATFNGNEDGKGNRPFHDFRDEPDSLYGLMPEGYSIPDIVRYMGGYEAPNQIRSPEESAQCIAQNFKLPPVTSYPTNNQPMAWTIAVGDALQRLLIRQYDCSEDGDWGSQEFTPCSTLQSFLTHAVGENHGIVDSSAQVREADVLQNPLSLTAALLNLVMRFKESQYEQIATAAGNSEILVFPDKHPRLRIQYVDPVLKLHVKGYITVAINDV